METEDPTLTAPTPPSPPKLLGPAGGPKRLVWLRPDGIHQIIGVIEEGPLPIIIPLGPESLPLDLVGVRERFATYRQPILPEVGRLGEFHPSQV